MTLVTVSGGRAHNLVWVNFFFFFFNVVSTVKCLVKMIWDLNGSTANNSFWTVQFTQFHSNYGYGLAALSKDVVHWDHLPEGNIIRKSSPWWIKHSEIQAWLPWSESEHSSHSATHPCMLHPTKTWVSIEMKFRFHLSSFIVKVIKT